MGDRIGHIKYTVRISFVPKRGEKDKKIEWPIPGIFFKFHSLLLAFSPVRSAGLSTSYIVYSLYYVFHCFPNVSGEKRTRAEIVVGMEQEKEKGS